MYALDGHSLHLAGFSALGFPMIPTLFGSFPRRVLHVRASVGGRSSSPVSSDMVPGDGAYERCRSSFRSKRFHIGSVSSSLYCFPLSRLFFHGTVSARPKLGLQVAVCEECPEGFPCVLSHTGSLLSWLLRRILHFQAGLGSGDVCSGLIFACSILEAWRGSVPSPGHRWLPDFGSGEGGRYWSHRIMYCFMAFVFVSVCAAALQIGFNRSGRSPRNKSPPSS